MPIIRGNIECVAMTETVRKRIEDQGRAAFFNGQADSVCPYQLNQDVETGLKRQVWMGGYIAESINSRVGKILTKYGQSLM